MHFRILPSPTQFLTLFVLIATKLNQCLAHDIFPNIGCPSDINKKFAAEAISKCDGVTFQDPFVPEFIQDPDKIPKFGIYCKKACILNQLGFVDPTGKKEITKATSGTPATYVPSGYWIHLNNFFAGITRQIGIIRYVPEWKGWDPKIKEIYEVLERTMTAVSHNCQGTLQSSFQEFGASCDKWNAFYDCMEQQLKEAKLCEMVKNREENIKYIRKFYNEFNHPKTAFPDIGCDKTTNLKFSDIAHTKCHNATYHIPNYPEIDAGATIPAFGIYCEKACILNQLGFLQTSEKTIVSPAKGDEPATALPKGYGMDPGEIFPSMCWQIGAVQYRPDLKGKDAKIKEIFEKAETSSKALTSCLTPLQNDFKERKTSCENWSKFYECVETTLKKSDLCEMVKKREENKKYIREFIKSQG